MKQKEVINKHSQITCLNIYINYILIIDFNLYNLIDYTFLPSNILKQSKILNIMKS